MPQKVLVIDDSPAVATLIHSRLRDEPVELSFAHDGVTGLRVARELRPDLILLDVDMPDHGGFEVCGWLKADPVTTQIPVIFLTGATGTAERSRGLDLGAVDHVTKPFEPAELRARVTAALRTKYLLDLLSKKAQIDGLTGLWNRTYFDDRLAQECAMSGRTGLPLSVLLMDVDRFKDVNDRLGHPFGDQVLRAVAQATVDAARMTEMVCRYGGAAFAIIAPNTPATGAAMLAERVRANIADLQVLSRGTPFSVTVSIGVAAVRTDGGNGAGAEAIAQAERATGAAQQGGGNRVVAALQERHAA